MSTPAAKLNRVKQYRLAHGLSQADLAMAAGVSRTGLSAIEVQRLVPSVATALALARALQTSVETLFDELPRTMPFGPPCRRDFLADFGLRTWRDESCCTPWRRRLGSRFARTERLSEPPLTLSPVIWLAERLSWLRVIRLRTIWRWSTRGRPRFE